MRVSIDQERPGVHKDPFRVFRSHQGSTGRCFCTSRRGANHPPVDRCVSLSGGEDSFPGPGYWSVSRANSGLFGVVQSLLFGTWVLGCFCTSRRGPFASRENHSFLGAGHWNVLGWAAGRGTDSMPHLPSQLETSPARLRRLQRGSLGPLRESQLEASPARLRRLGRPCLVWFCVSILGRNGPLRPTLPVNFFARPTIRTNLA